MIALLDSALKVRTLPQYRQAARVFQAHSDASYARVLDKLKWRRVRGLFNEPRAQYDPHAQLIFRLRDQNGAPVSNFDIYFHSLANCRVCVSELFEHTHKNRHSDGVITFYLRTAKFDASSNAWVDRLATLDRVQLEISPTEPRTDDIRYLPVCLTLSGDRLRRFNPAPSHHGGGCHAVTAAGAQCISGAARGYLVGVRAARGRPQHRLMGEGGCGQRGISSRGVSPDHWWTTPDSSRPRVAIILRKAGDAVFDGYQGQPKFHFFVQLREPLLGIHQAWVE